MNRPRLPAALAALVSSSMLACEAPEAETFVGGGGTLSGVEGQGGADTDPDTADSGGAGGALPPLQSSCASGEPGVVADLASVRLTSTITWSLDFDAEAEALGATDCSYSRSFDGLQRFGWEHLCPTCDFITQGDATMTDGLDCYAQISSSPGEVRTELWAIGAGTQLRRSGRAPFPMPTVLAELGAPSGDGEVVPVAWTSEANTLTGGGTFGLSASGTLSWRLDEGERQADPWGPRAAAYACGWECEDPGDRIGVSPMAIGETIPNGRFRDQCGEMVDLWDFHGSYLVIDASQHDCGPCRSMAQSHGDFVQQMRAAGIPVRVVTLMGNGLSATWETPPEETVEAWVEAYDLTEPVLADAAWTLSYFPDFIEGYSGEDYGYPAWIVVDPSLRPIHGNVGFSSWDAVSEVILSDVEGRRSRGSTSPVGLASAPAPVAPTLD